MMMITYKMKSLTFLFFILFHLNLYGDSNDLIINYDYENKKYTIRYEFITSCDMYKLLDIFYNFDHIKKYFNHFKNITILEKEENWYTADYYFELGIYSFHAIYKRTINFDKKIVYYDLINYKQSINLLPNVLKSSGYYKVIKYHNMVKVIYYQETYLNKMGKILFKIIHKNKTEKFFKILLDYIECNK